MRYGSVLLSLLVVAGLAIGGLGNVAAQEGTPVSSEDAMLPDTFGLPELEIALTDEGFQGVPSETEAGWHVVTFSNTSSNEFGAVNFVLLADGITVDDLMAPAEMDQEGAGAEGVSSPTAEEIEEGLEAIATPEDTADEGEDSADAETDMDMGSPAAGGEDPFAWLYETYIAGGVGAGPGQTRQGIVYLESGDYAVWAEDPFAPIPPEEMTVTEVAEASPEAIDFSPSATITEVGEGGAFFDFEVEGQLQPGTQVIEIYNDTDQPHFVEILWSPDPVTDDQITQILETEEGAPLPEGVPDPDQWQTAAYASTQSAGTTQYVAVNLEPGYYILACFIPDPLAGGVPHAFEGMVQVVPVGVEGDDSATPAA